LEFYNSNSWVTTLYLPCVSKSLKMNCTWFRYKSAMLLCAMLSFYVALYVIGNFYTVEEYITQSGNDGKASGSVESNMVVEHLSSNDFSLTHENGRDENVHHAFVYTLHGDKLLRECIFDREKMRTLTRTLIWFTHSTYQASLPPLWHPSISIAHRRLII